MDYNQSISGVSLQTRDRQNYEKGLLQGIAIGLVSAALGYVLIISLLSI